MYKGEAGKTFLFASFKKLSPPDEKTS